jgi:hypothetical protein
MLKKFAGLILALLTATLVAPSAWGLNPQFDFHSMPETSTTPWSHTLDVPNSADGGDSAPAANSPAAPAQCYDLDGTLVPCTDGYGGVWSGYCYRHVVSDDPWDPDPRYAPTWESVHHAPGVLMACFICPVPGLSNDPVWVPTADPPPSRHELEQAARFVGSGVVTAPQSVRSPGGRKVPVKPYAMGRAPWARRKGGPLAIRAPSRPGAENCPRPAADVSG